ncbi:MAG: class I SAM-dependent methyltransferase [Gaiellales bacterium]
MPLAPISTLPRRVAGRARRKLVAGREWLATRGYRRQLGSLAAGKSLEYREYLETQLARSVGRRANDPGVGQRILVGAALAAAAPGASVLCVGCRNGLELDAFRDGGLGDVRGIDIFSQRPDIEVMDMHAMTFPDATFDVVYSSHSLEHSHDLARVAAELVRVAKPGAVLAVEVPVRHKGSAADVVVFQGIDDLERVFSPHLGEVVLREEEPPHSARNEQGSDIARLVARLSGERSAELSLASRRE